MSEYNLTIGEAFKAMLDEGATVHTVGVSPIRISDGVLIYADMEREVLKPFHWGNCMFKIVEPKKETYRLMTMVEILEKFTDAKFDELGQLRFKDGRVLYSSDFKRLGYITEETIWDNDILVETTDDC